MLILKFNFVNYLSGVATKASKPQFDAPHLCSSSRFLDQSWLDRQSTFASQDLQESNQSIKEEDDGTQPEAQWLPRRMELHHCL
jgi:hypothetical protein